MAASTFVVGDIVELNSGGPVMTIEQLDGDSCYCVWFDDKGKRGAAPFLQANLRRHEPMKKLIGRPIHRG